MRLRPPFVRLFACWFKTHSPLEIRLHRQTPRRASQAFSYPQLVLASPLEGGRTHRYSRSTVLSIDGGSPGTTLVDVSGAIRRVLKSCKFRAMGRGPRARGFTLKRLGLMRSPGTPTQPTGVPGPSLREFSLDYVFEPIAGSPNFPHNLPAARLRACPQPGGAELGGS